VFPVTVVITESDPTPNALATHEITFIYLQEVENEFLAKAYSQKLIIDGFSWELTTLYTPGDAANPKVNDECVICIDNPVAVILMPCRHYCICEDCIECCKVGDEQL
jgi:hypothetical protein